MVPEPHEILPQAASVGNLPRLYSGTDDPRRIPRLDRQRLGVLSESQPVLFCELLDFRILQVVDVASREQGALNVMLSQFHQPGAVPSVGTQDQDPVNVVKSQLGSKKSHCLEIGRDKQRFEVYDRCQFYLDPGFFLDQLISGHLPVEAHHGPYLGAEVGLSCREAFRCYDFTAAQVDLVPETVHHFFTICVVRVKECKACHEQPVADKADKGVDLLGINHPPSENILPQGGDLGVGREGDHWCA